MEKPSKTLPSSTVAQEESSLTRILPRTLKFNIWTNQSEHFNVDGTENKKGTIKAYVDLDFKLNDRRFKERFYVTGLGRQKMILGFPWLNKHNPDVDWKKGTLTW